jgi:hypothetical protein
MVERQTDNLEVEGSSPSGPTINSGVIQLAETTTVNRRVRGSTPFPGASKEYKYE